MFSLRQRSILLKKIITTTPSSVLGGNTLYYVEMNPVKMQATMPLLLPTSPSPPGDTLPPSITFNPANGATNVSAIGNIIITFSEPIRKLDDSPVTPADIKGGLVELKVTNNGGAAVLYTATINGTSTIITLNPNATLLANQVYYVEVNPIEDAVNNPTTSDNITFTTEDQPSFSSFVPAAAARCIGDNVTINGARFTGTGNPVSGNTAPTVYINGVAVAAGNIVSFNSTQVIFTLPVVYR